MTDEQKADLSQYLADTRIRDEELARLYAASAVERQREQNAWQTQRDAMVMRHDAATKILAALIQNHDGVVHGMETTAGQLAVEAVYLADALRAELAKGEP